MIYAGHVARQAGAHLLSEESPWLPRGGYLAKGSHIVSVRLREEHSPGAASTRDGYEFLLDEYTPRRCSFEVRLIPADRRGWEPAPA